MRVKQLDENNIEYKAYLHENKHVIVEDLESLGVELSEEARAELVYAFYEIEIDCLINTKTGAIQLVGVEGQTLG